MNGHAVTTQDFYAEILELHKALDRLKAKVLRTMPVTYGSDTWWEQGEKKVDDELQKGKAKTFTSGNEFLRYMKTLT